MLVVFWSLFISGTLKNYCYLNTHIPYLGIVSMILNLESAFGGSIDYFQSLICSSSLRNL